MRDSGPKAQQILRFVREVTRDSAAVLARTQQLLPRPTVGACLNNGKDAVRAVARTFFEVVTLGRHGVGDMGDADDAALERVRDAGGTVVMATAVDAHWHPVRLHRRPNRRGARRVEAPRRLIGRAVPLRSRRGGQRVAG